ncbi:F-box/LRR-repeat protein At3g26922-like [Lolium rigidum]|uniref:F-box/LRR-repeat protein At3g26922-like n=1 Tax=Lolium rigidum TaxID=89674 RepID=UPI001F5DF0AB|nr:F-box/LRR-repeat protein At3g26922-like [Lolium rigidum]
MPKRLRSKGNKKAAVSGGEDRLSALPEDVILLLLSFLTSRQAVQMSVLGPRWRALWKSLPSLRFDMGLDHTSHSFHFIESLIRYRDPTTPLFECEILSSDRFSQDVDMCLRYAVSRKVRDLRIKIYSLRYFQLSAGTFFSKHLTRLFLRKVWLDDFYLHVSSCNSLEELEIKRCDINIGDVGTHFPKSLRLLRIRNTNIDPIVTRSFISAPGLVTLELAVGYECALCLKSMPSLVTAFIKIGHKSGFSYCEACEFDDGVLLKGLSGATNLELIRVRSMVFRKEIKCYPTFSKLKTLLLSDWCMASNFTGLVYFLQHSPILERFTLQLGRYCEKTQMHEVYPKEQFMVSKHLKAIEITYFQKDVRVDQIVNFLAYHGVHPKLINIERKPYDDCFSFKRKE